MGADSRGLVGQVGPANVWLLPGKACGCCYFLKLALPAQFVTCTGSRETQMWLPKPKFKQQGCHPEVGEKEQRHFWLQENIVLAGLPLK